MVEVVSSNQEVESFSSPEKKISDNSSDSLSESRNSQENFSTNSDSQKNFSENSNSQASVQATSQESGDSQRSSSGDFKRNVAYKFRIGDLLVGRPVFDEAMNRFNYLDLENKKIVRVNIVANIVDKYESEGETKFISFTIDDGSGQIKMRVFSDDVEKFRNFSQGQTVIVIGLLRSYNNEVYITPEIIREQDPRYLLVRKLEVEKQRNESVASSGVSEMVGGGGETSGSVSESGGENIGNTGGGGIREKIIDFIKNAETEGGADTDKIVTSLRETSPEIINQEIQKLLEQGILFEPRPGKLRWLGQ